MATTNGPSGITPQSGNYHGMYTDSVSGAQIPITSGSINIGGTNVPISSGYITTASKNVQVDWKPKCSYHQTGELLEYSDGIIIAQCVECGDTIQVTRLPGGINELALQMLLISTRTGELSEEDMKRYANLRCELVAEREALELAFEQLAILDAMVAQLKDV